MDTVAITGLGGMGMAIARRLGVGQHLVLGDADKERVASAADLLTQEGYSARPMQLDVADRSSVNRFAVAVTKTGRLSTLVHTAGLSPAMASAERILAVDLMGTIHMLKAFLPRVTKGTVGVFVASMAGNLVPVPAEMEQTLAIGTPTEVLGLVKALANNPDPTTAYGIAKRANQLRVQAAAPAWGRRGGRVISISPGIVSTPMGLLERSRQPLMEHMLSVSPVPRIGTAEDIAQAVAWLASPAAGFITGSDVLVDGGVVAALRWASAN